MQTSQRLIEKSRSPIQLLTLGRTKSVPKNKFQHTSLWLACLFKFAGLNDILHSFEPSIFPSIIEMKLTYNTVRLKCATWQFDICLYCEMISTVRLLNTSIASRSYLFVYLWWELPLATFKMQHSIVKYSSILYTGSPKLTHLITGSLYPFTTFTHSLPSLIPDNHQSALCFYEFIFFRFHIWERSYSIWLSLTCFT